MTRAGLVLAAACWAALGLSPARAGEDPQAVQMEEALLQQQLGVAAGRAEVVAVVTVTEVSEPVPAGEKGAPAAPAGLNTGAQLEARIITVDVGEALKGGQDLRTVKIRVFTNKFGAPNALKNYLLFRMTSKRAAGDPGGSNSGTSSYPLLMTKGRKCLVFLKPEPPPPPAAEGKVEGQAEGKVAEKERAWRLAAPPFCALQEKATAAARQALKSLVEWDNPPKLSAEDEAAVIKLIVDLGSDEFKVRAAASKSLAARGAAARARLEAAIKTSEDPEVKTRAEGIIEELKPAIQKFPQTIYSQCEEAD